MWICPRRRAAVQYCTAGSEHQCGTSAHAAFPRASRTGGSKPEVSRFQTGGPKMTRAHEQMPAGFAPAAGAWKPADPSYARALLAGISAPWWIVGGWAIDLFLGHRSRAHKDLDVGILRPATLKMLAALPRSDAPAASWLHQALQLTHPDHPWLHHAIFAR